MFLEDSLPYFGKDRFSVAAFGQFQLNDRGMIMPNGWEAYAGIRAVSGVSYDEYAYAGDPEAKAAGLARVSVAEAEAAVAAAIAEAPLPTKEVTATPVPSDTPIPLVTPASAATPVPEPTVALLP